MNLKNITAKSLMAVAGVSMLAGCSDSFLEQDPLSFYEPAATYKTEAGLKSALAKCDKSVREFLCDGNGNVLPIASVYNMSDVGLYAKTDVGDFQDDFATKITPTGGMKGGGDENAMMRFWTEAFNGIKYANTVLTYVDQVKGLDEKTRDAYKGRAYFHRAYKYYHMVLLFGDLPLVTILPDGPKQNYKSTSKEAIFEMLVHDLEFASKHVPPLKDCNELGVVNQEACLHLLAKCYLVTGQYKEAAATCEDLINNHGLALMRQPFGQFVAGEQETWPVTRNVVWDLHRGENIALASNTECILPMLNFNDADRAGYPLMRAMCVHWSNGGAIRDPHNLSGPTQNYARNNGNYNKELDWLRTMGRGIGCFRTSYHFNKTMWNYNGETDWQDLRHNREMGNWIEMEDIKYNNPSSDFYGKPMQLYATEDYMGKDGLGDKEGKPIVKAGQLLCTDTIRSWYPTPLYKVYILDQTAENNMGANQFNGNSTGSNANQYIFRLAETYLILAEARFYQGDFTGAANAVNEVRKRANSKTLYTTVTIGDIADERARELYLEEWRQPELTRISWCLAKSGQKDEWGHTYDPVNWCKQSGTDAAGGSYWYQRLTHYSIFNKGTITSNNKELNYRVDKRNVFWPIPNSAITANINAQLRQNFGYTGYDENIEMFTNWEDAVADEKKM